MHAVWIKHFLRRIPKINEKGIGDSRVETCVDLPQRHGHPLKAFTDLNRTCRTVMPLLRQGEGTLKLGSETVFHSSRICLDILARSYTARNYKFRR